MPETDSFDNLHRTDGDSSDLLVDMREDRHQLIVLGNGFDLTCGLPSAYKDFFKGMPRIVFPKPEALGNVSWGNYLRDKGLTAWDIILCNKGAETNWYDVEKDIARWVTQTSGTGLDHAEKVSRLLKGNEYSIPGFGRLPERWREYSGDDLRQYPEANVARYLLDTRDECSDAWTRSRVLGALFYELRLLERRFAKYLDQAIDANPGYTAQACELLAEIEESRTYPEDYRYQVSVLNFNYTMPYSEHVLKCDYHTDQINIHGCIVDRDVVFGIDGRNCLNDSDALPFTKTYRILDMDGGGIADIVFAPNNSLGMATSVIKFFGHSLSIPDYSYFQALFDTVNLYGGETELVFYYRPYHPDDHDGKMAREETMRRVTRLLYSYGKTLDNKDHGKNLIHKLILEGRLHVQAI